MNISNARILNITLTLLGMILFFSAFIYINFSTQDFNDRTRSFAISKTQEKVGNNLNKIIRSSNRLNSITAIKNNEFLIAKDDLVSAVLTAACKFDCTKKEESVVKIDSIFQSFNIKNRFAIKSLKSLIENEYDDIMIDIRNDLSIFTASNAAIFIIAFILSIFRGKAAVHLIPISFIMTFATIIMTCFYIFGQNWMMTILTNDFWGWSYSFFLIIITIFLADIAINSARITTILFNIIGGVFSKLPILAPC